jgi:formiminoglutamase
VNASALSHDPQWPRAGDWPAASDVAGPIDLGLLGIPAHLTSLSPTNAHLTPAAIRDALRRYSPALMPDRGHRDVAPLEHLVCADFGDITDPDSPEGEARTIAAMSEARGRSSLVVALGGDNSVTVAAALGAFGDDLSSAGLITLDAHYDLRDGVSNGSPVRRLIEAGLDPHRVVQIGIQDFANSAEYAARARDYGITVIHRDECERRPMDDIMREALEISGSANGPVHVDIDVDVCDRSVAPACPASVPGGLSAFDVRRAARIAAADPRVASIDLVEVDASADTLDNRTIRLSALLVLEALAGVSTR